MPYVHHVRTREDHHVACHSERRAVSGGVITPSDWSVNLPRMVEHVYSWRTGRRNVSDAAPSDTSVFGIKTPRETGGLIDKIADRKRYYDEVMRAAYPAETASGSVSTDRTSNSDSGHLFSKVTTLRYPMEVEVDASSYNPASPNGTYSAMRGRIFISTASVATPQVTNHGWFTYPYVTGTASLTTAIQRQGTANAFFADSTPERPTANILVTVAELLRGDIPSLLKNYRRALFDYQSKTRSLRYAGGEYLSIQFGWLPLISEYANVLKVLIGLDRMVYSESNRRTRMWDGPSTSVVNDYATRPFSSSIITGTGEKFQYLTGTPVTYAVQQYDTRERTLVKEDYKFSSRFSALVKPNSKSVGFVERAEEVLRQLGLVDSPTLLWELTPFSWLVDWVSHIGNSISNAHYLSPLSGRHAVDYAYFTTQLTRVVDAEIVRASTPTAIWRTANISMVRRNAYFSTVQRVRDRATPFGFGTQLGSLNASQFAILIALGLARSR